MRECVSASADDAERFARRAVAEGCGALVVCGGDGIVHLALQAVAGTHTALGVIPAGSGNDFARAAGIPLGDLPAAVATICGGHSVSMDLGRANGRWFGTVLASGFDSRVTDRMNSMRWPRGKARYHAAIVAELAAFRPLPFVLEVDGERREVEAMLVAVGNGSTYGGGMRICPAARTDDGLFDVTVITTLSRAKLIRLFPRVYPGTHVERREVLTFRCSELTSRLSMFPRMPTGSSSRHFRCGASSNRAPCGYWSLERCGASSSVALARRRSGRRGNYEFRSGSACRHPPGC